MRLDEDRNTRYYVDVDLKTQTILNWGFGHKIKLAKEELLKSSHHRIFISKGQYNKLEQKDLDVRTGPAKKR